MQVRAESLMTLTLTPHTPTVPPTYTIDGDGYEVPTLTPGTPHAGKVQSRSGGLGAAGDTTARYVEIGGTPRPVLSGGLHIPISAPVPLAGEQRNYGTEYVVTAVGSMDDPALLGRRFLVVAVPVKSFATARRLDVIEL
ncbi:DUF6093 family protein [Aeromicrobium sp.]|uniref:DUF6093 family protein n=1 Tax=Aeromicrobium sp. TaxID=1871063 RepID=UPI002FC7069B